MLDAVLSALLGWIWVEPPRKGSHLSSVGFFVGAPIWILFGILFAAAGSTAFSKKDWTPERFVEFALLIFGILMIASVAASVVGLLRKNGKEK